MIKLTDSRDCWGTTSFEATFKAELARLSTDQLPLQSGLTLSSHVTDGPRAVVLLRSSEAPNQIHVKAGIFYFGIIAGCSCADDPTPISEQTEYCEVQVVINKQTAEATVALSAGD